MSRISLASWNVNGIRSVARKGFFDWLAREQPDLVCLQETKISADQLTGELSSPPGYTSFWSHAEKRGYSGVVLYSKEKPHSVEHGLGIERFDREGRTIKADYGHFVLFNVYFPNGKASQDRLDFKLDFYDAFLDTARRLTGDGKKLVVCGDFNTAHKEIDLARPKANQKISGFLPVERKWMDSFVEAGFTDTFRDRNEEPHNYTWWHMRTGARARNVGWRIDYFFVSDTLRSDIVDAGIQSQTEGSDHCPITLTLAY